MLAATGRQALDLHKSPAAHQRRIWPWTFPNCQLKELTFMERQIGKMNKPTAAYTGSSSTAAIKNSATPSISYQILSAHAPVLHCKQE